MLCSFPQIFDSFDCLLVTETSRGNANYLLVELLGWRSWAWGGHLRAFAMIDRSKYKSEV
jgi:hypothetical protein